MIEIVLISFGENMIENKDITFVIQGPIIRDNKNINLTAITSKSIRKNFAESTIILSTWEGENVENIEYDKVIFNKDPGSTLITFEGVERFDNTNRMILSSINGINLVETLYCLKVRSDIEFTSNKIKSLFKIYNVTLPMQIFDEKIVTLSAFNPKRIKVLFHLNDWIDFGMTKDLKKKWDLELKKEDDYNNTNDNIPRIEDTLTPEQYICLFLYRKYINKSITIKNMYYYNRKIHQEFDKFIVSNFVLFNAEEIGIKSLKYNYDAYAKKNISRFYFYTHNEWRKLYDVLAGTETKKTLILEDFAILVFKFYLAIKKNYYFNSLIKKIRNIK